MMPGGAFGKSAPRTPRKTVAYGRTASGGAAGYEQMVIIYGGNLSIVGAGPQISFGVCYDHG